MNADASFEDETFKTPQVEVLTAQKGNVTLGFRIGGFHAGPELLVVGHDPVAGLVYDRLMQLPALGWMRGRLTMVFLNEMERNCLPSDIGTLIASVPDDLFFLPYQLDAAFHAEASAEGYWSVLRSCTRLGMISGRGVPLNLRTQP